jgi:4-amino-4-deoxy-L-arabinose transferase-like glycosyltransferase
VVPRRPGAFALALGGIAALGGLIRVLWIEKAEFKPFGLIVDEQYYHRVANFVADGMGFISPAAFDAGAHLPSAEKPPLYPLLLAAESKAGFSSFHAHQLLGALLGMCTIVLLALVARRVGGPRLALITAALVALDPVLWKWDSHVLSEPLYAPLLALVLLAAYAFGDQPTLRRGAALGVAIGLAALTRPEALIFVPLLLLLFAVKQRRVAAKPLAVMCIATAITLAPWVIRNVSAFDRVMMSNQSGETIAGANCPTTYNGIGIGFWDVTCLKPVGTVTQNEAERVGAQKSTGLRYAQDHLGRVPVVLAARVGRTWGFFRPVATGLDELVAWILLGLGVAGVVILRRRRAPVAILLLPAAVVTVASMLSFGWLRYRFGADLAFIVLAAVTLEALLLAAVPRLRSDP